MRARPRLRLAILLAGGVLGLATMAVRGAPEPTDAEPNRSPIALAFSSDGTRLLTANQTSGSVSLVDPKAGRVLAEVTTGDKPAGVAISRDGQRGLVSHWYGYDVALLEIKPDTLRVVGRIEVGPEPRGVAISADGKAGYVAVGVSNEVVRIDLDANKVTGRLEVGREPRGLAITPDGSSLLIGNARSQSMTVVSVGPWKVERTIPIDGDNLRQVAISADGKTGYVANMKNRHFPTTQNNIDNGWVLGQRLTSVPIDGSDTYSTLSLDPRGKAASDAHGVAASPDGRYLAISCGGTHEVMIFRTDLRRLPWRNGGSRDLLAVELINDSTRFRRVPVGGRPTELTFDPNGKNLYVANYLENAVQVIDAESGDVVRTIALGGPKEVSLARRGEILFHDAERSFNQWYSCNTCHSDGHTNGLDFDTMNDGSHDFSTAHQRSRKKVPSLRGVTRTGPWTWHGWQKSLSDATIESFTKSMQGRRPKSDEVNALVAYLGTLDFPKNPYRESDGGLSAAAERGRAIFQASKTACNNCHGGPEFSDGKIHIVGLEEPDDAYQGYNPPSLQGVYDKDPYLHDGRSKTLRETLVGPHSPETVSGVKNLDDHEVDDLIAYLKTL